MPRGRIRGRALLFRVAREGTEVVRTFVAIELPDSLRRKLELTIDGLKDGSVDDDVRWARAESIHLTLKFLGEIDEETAETAQRLLNEVALEHPRFAISVGGFGCFPNLKAPRIFWIGVEAEDDRLLSLQSDLESRLANVGIPSERRRYHPHLTIGRVRKRLSSAELRALSEWASEAHINNLGKTEVSEVSLMQSDLKPTGAVYTTLHRAVLMA